MLHTFLNLSKKCIMICVWKPNEIFGKENIDNDTRKILRENVTDIKYKVAITRGKMNLPWG